VDNPIFASLLSRQLLDQGISGPLKLFKQGKSNFPMIHLELTKLKSFQANLQAANSFNAGGMMNLQEAMPVPVCIADSIVEEIEEMYDHITKRAYEIFHERSGFSTLDLEDWLTAERELLFKPDVFIEETNYRITVTACIGKVRPMDVRLLVTPDAMVIQAKGSMAAKKIFRTVQFPRRIDVSKAEASYANGCLVLTV